MSCTYDETGDSRYTTGWTACTWQKASVLSYLENFTVETVEKESIDE